MRSMNFLRYTSIVKADHLMIDDWFKMGGNVYRIADLEILEDEKTVKLLFRSITQNSITKKHLAMIVPYKTKFKIYNQK